MRITASPLELIVALGLANHLVLEESDEYGESVCLHSSGSGAAGAGTDHPLDYHPLEENHDLDVHRLHHL